MGPHQHRQHHPPRSVERIRLARPSTAALVLGLLAVGLGACGSTGGEGATARVEPRRAAAGAGAARSQADPAAIALVVTDEGLAGVPVGSSTPTWVAPGAVAAPDGSAVFRTRPVAGDGFEVVRIDPRTGAETGVGRHAPGPAGIHVAAVEPGGGRVALAAPSEGGAGTLVLDFDPERGGPDRKPTFEGTLEPEAYSVDRTRLFAARTFGDRYHVHVLDLASGQQEPTLGPDKLAAPEDMYGEVVQAALSPDRTQLATLYRDTVKPEHTGFVHLLSLETGSTVCIDLHEPFGTEPGADALAWQPDGTVAVGHTAADPARSMVATFDPAAIWSGPPQPHYHAAAEPDPEPPAVPAGLTAVPGFRRFVALVPEAA